MRRYIRHPSSVPITFTLGDKKDPHEELTSNIGHGGLCFRSNDPVELGTGIHITIPVHQPAFEAEGTVVWCKDRGDHFEVGVEFGDTDLEFRVRMVEQVCYIEHYRKEVEHDEGRNISGREAALEWIRKYGGNFPHLD